MATCRPVGSPVDREQLIRECLPDVQARAWEIARQVPRHVEVQDLIAVGNVALVQAAGRWDAAGGASFRAYAYTRVRGAMLDHIRSHSTMNRHDARRSSAIERARFRFAAREGRFPSGVELARNLGWSARQLSVYEDRIVRAAPYSLQEMVVGPCGDPAWLEELIPADVDIERDVCAHESATEMAGHIRALPSTEQRVIRWTYWEDRKLREMGEWLGVSESRVCQIRTAALKHLRELAPGLQEAA